VHIKDGQVLSTNRLFLLPDGFRSPVEFQPILRTDSYDSIVMARRKTGMDVVILPFPERTALYDSAVILQKRYPPIVGASIQSPMLRELG